MSVGRYKIFTLGLLILMGLSFYPSMSQAQTCLTNLDEIATACADIESGQVCQVTEEGTQITPLNNENEFSTVNDAAFFNIPLADDQATLQYMLFGAMSVQNAVADFPDPLPQLEATNAVGYTVNLRGGPALYHPIVGSFEWNGTYIADGRSADNGWIRIQQDEEAWVSAELITLAGDITDLVVLDTPYLQPMQAVTLSPLDEEGCSPQQSGLLIRHRGTTDAQIQVNQVDLTLNNGLFLVQMASETEMTLTAIDSTLEALIGSETLTAAEGQSIAVTSAEEAWVGEVLPTYEFARVADVPLSLVSDAETDALVCIAGVSDDKESYAIPTSDAQTVLTLSPQDHYTVTGWSADADGERWWQVLQGNQVGWVPQDDVETVGLCDSILEIDPALATNPAPANPPASSNPADTSAGTAPSGFMATLLADRSIWQANSGEEVSTGTCNFPPLTLCEHLVAIIPNADGTISWRGQEPAPYTLYPGGDNFYSYEGRNQRGNADLRMALTFHNENSWTMTMVQVFDNDPECIRTFYYTASRNW